MDAIDEVLLQLGELDNDENQQTVKEIDIFDAKKSDDEASVEPQPHTSLIQRDSDDEDELSVYKPELSDNGKKIAKMLKKESASCKSEPIKTTATPGKAAIENLDEFKIAVRDVKVSSQTFGMFTAGMKLVRLSHLRPSSSFKESWCTVGVIVEKGISKKSSNGNEYLIWKLHDLLDCQSPTIKLLMFGGVIEQHWKIPIGSAIALLSCQVTPDSSKPTQTVLKVSKATSLVEIGRSAYFGTCRHENCGRFVNTSVSEYCVYHVMSAARKFSANRGTFNAVCGVPKKVTCAVKPAACNTKLEPKMVSKKEERKKLEELIEQRRSSLAVRPLLKLRAEDVHEEEKKKLKHESMHDFLKRDDDLIEMTSEKRSLWKKPPLGSKDAQEYAARLRAIAIMKRKRDGQGAVKRKAESSPQEAAKKPKMDDKIRELLNRKSLHQSEADAEQEASLGRHLDRLEQREKVETFTSTCMAVKNVNVVTCKVCKYTAQSSSSYCRENKHDLVKHTAEKRFFKCTGCKHRTTCFELMPIRPCQKCNENKWERVAMKDERKVETEKLLLRGEERKYVN